MSSKTYFLAVYIKSTPALSVLPILLQLVYDLYFVLIALHTYTNLSHEEQNLKNIKE